jgi:hypothetical protein
MKFRFVLQEPDDEPNNSPPSPSPAPAVLPRRGTLRYGRGNHGLLRLEKDGERATALTNFDARIVSDFLLDDGERGRREFGVEADLGGRKTAFVLSAAEFARMDWALNRLGPRAIIYPGQKQHARAAIQWLSREIRQEHIYTHLGWRKHGPHWVYLHAAGALGTGGLQTGVRVQAPAALEYYQVQSPPSAELVEAIRVSLECLSVAPDRISFPLLAVVYRAALGKVDFSVFLAGLTGVFKTALAALCQQHFGRSMDAMNLPANFASTGNALEGIAFHAKDALLVVDDFAPTGTHRDSELDRIAERLFRAAGNQQGRSRLGGNGRLSAPKPPRALVLATGEKVPPGRSIRARLLVVEVDPGEVNRTKLSLCQHSGQQGKLSAAMGAYLVWVAARYDELQERLRDRVREIRREGRGRAIHARLPTALAELQAAWEIFLDFALEVGAITKTEKQQLEERNENALNELVERQAKYQLGSDPAALFVCFLRAALVRGIAHVADRTGGMPPAAAAWGWRCEPGGQRCLPQGPCIGWLSGDDLFLNAAVSYRVVRSLGGQESVPLSEQTLRRRLHDHGLLVSTDAGREMLTVRRTLAGCARQVLHLNATALSAPTDTQRASESQPNSVRP